MTLYIMNTTIILAPGIWEAREINNDNVINLIESSTDIVSAVGHSSTADIITSLISQTGITVEMNRIEVNPKVNDILVCLKLNQRAPEGSILSLQEIEAIGYTWWGLYYKSL